MAVCVRQPIVSGIGVVAIFAVTHGVFDVGGDHALCAIATSKLMQGLFQIFAKFKAAWVKKQVVRACCAAFLIIKWVVERVMAVGAFELAFCVNIPRASEGFFICQIHARY